MPGHTSVYSVRVLANVPTNQLIAWNARIREVFPKQHRVTFDSAKLLAELTEMSLRAKSFLPRFSRGSFTEHGVT